MNEAHFPTGDLTMLSVSVHETSARLHDLIHAMKQYPEDAFLNKGEAIANATIALRSLEDAHFRILRSKQHVATDSLAAESLPE